MRALKALAFHRRASSILATGKFKLHALYLKYKIQIFLQAALRKKFNKLLKNLNKSFS